MGENRGPAHARQGDDFRERGNYREALAAYRESLLCDSTQARVWYAAGASETALKLFAEATVSFRKALRIEPDWPEAKHNLARAYFQLGLIDEALSFFRDAATCNNPELSRQAIAVIIPGSPAADNRVILRERQRWADHHPAVLHQLPVLHKAPGNIPASSGKLRIGYLSAFFGNDNWMKPVWGLIDQHDRGRFEIHLFSDTAAAGIGHPQNASDYFHDIGGLSNEAAASLIEACGIELLVDLNGYSTPGRLPVIAAHPARVVVAWFNMYATSGTGSYDYLIGDSEVIPSAEEPYYCERIVRVPGSYLTFNVHYPVPEVADPPALKGNPVTFGCLASQYKTNPDVIRIWCDILKAVPDSRLVLRNSVLSSPGNCRFVQKLFANHGVAPDRVVMLGGTDHFRFLQTYNEIDIALDTFPYNGGTTTTEALWQGVPVVTFWGDRWASRTSASLLRAAGLNDFVADSVEGYVALAARLGNGGTIRGYLSELRRNMRAKLRESPVCATRTFARNMERLYLEMASGEMASR